MQAVLDGPVTRAGSRTRGGIALALLAGGLLAATLAGAQADGAVRQALLFAGVAVLAGIAAYDSLTLRAPNVVVYPAAVVASLAPASLGLAAWLDSLGGAGLAFMALVGAAALSRGAMGYGDAKVGYVAGAIVGLGGALPMLIATFVAGGFFAAVALTLGLRGRKDAVAFTPFILIGALAALLFVEASVYLE